MNERPDVGPPAASVIVLAYDAASHIRGCLDALAAQAGDVRFEVIVVWSGDPVTRDIVERDYQWVRLVGRGERLRTGAARNLGLAHARCCTIAFLAADCRVAPDWLARRLAGHEEGFRLVGGAVLCAQPAGALAAANHLVEYSLALPGRPRSVVRGEPLYNLSFRREVFERHGTYDATLASGEDVFFNWRLVRAGEPMLFDPSIRMFHPGPASWRRFLAHHFAHGLAFAALSARSDYAGRRFGGALSFLMIPAYPLVRLGGVVARTARWDRGNLMRLALYTPIVLAGVAAATLGMARGWRRQESAT